jgi:hypothetical protein
MSLTAIAVIILGAWLAITSQAAVSSTLQLVVGIVVVVLVLIDHRGAFAPRRPPA